jgi:hypothetical protein
LAGDSDKMLYWNGTDHVVQLQDIPTASVNDYSLGLTKIAKDDQNLG